MRPGGPWQRQHAVASRKQETTALTTPGRPTHFSTGIPVSYPRTSLRSYSGGLTTSPSPQIRPKALPNRKKKVEQPRHPHRRKEIEGKQTAPHSPPAPCSPPTSSISTSGTSSSSSTPGAVAPGALFPLRGGGGVLHPLVACWAIFLAMQASALAP